MPVIAIINRKGGSGKSTLSTHLAAYAANIGITTMLGDIDRQHSSKTWLALRNAVPDGQRPPILTWAVDVGGSLHPPASAQWVVLDTPGGLYGLELAKVVMAADVVLIPVCNSVFDRESAAMCMNEMKQFPKIKMGKCKIGVIGMRVDARTHGATQIAQWAKTQDVPYITHIRDASLYVRCAEMGLTIFDLLPAKMHFDLLQWQPILDWLKPYLDAAKTPRPVNSAPTRSQPLLQEVPHIALAPVHRLTPTSPAITPPPILHTQVAAKKGLFQSLGLPSFLRKK